MRILSWFVLVAQLQLTLMTTHHISAHRSWLVCYNISLHMNYAEAFDLSEFEVSKLFCQLLPA
jgi:hypothetical protein